MLQLYPQVKVKGQSFKTSKKYAVPSQAMSLAEILRRFVRREQLPVSKEGIYTTSMGDLEKIAREDIFDQHERVAELKVNIAKAEKRMKDADEKRIADEIARQAAESIRNAASAQGQAATSANGSGDSAANV